ncbi:MAG: PAS domain S-box protein [Desulfobacterales bacterium]|nr:PAS domain S-box protein [Desulfobacterales bacterium]
MQIFNGPARYRWLFLFCFILSCTVLVWGTGQVEGSGSPVNTAFAICIIQTIIIAYLLIRQRHTSSSNPALSKTIKFEDNLIHAANTLILGLDIKGNVTLINPAAQKITGYSESELKGKNWFHILIPEGNYQVLWQGFHHFLNHGLPKLCENQIITKAGNIRTISWSHNKIEQDGKLVGTISIGIDITKRKRAEKLLKESEEKYKEIIDGTPDIRYRTDLAGNIIFISKAVQRLTGYSVEEITGNNITRLYLYPKERNKILAILKEKGVLSDHEVRLKRKGGSFWWAASNSQLLKDQKGNVIGVEGIIRDITRRKVAENSLKKNEERLRLALEGTNTGLYEWYPETDETYFSPTFFTMLGYEPDMFAQNYQTWADLLHPEDRSIAEKFVKNVNDEQMDFFEHRFRMRLKGGGYRWILSIGSVVRRGKKGQNRRIIGIHVDITDRKKAADRLRDSEMRMRAIFDQTFQFMALLSPEGNLLTQNRFSLEFINAKESDVQGKPFWETPWWRHSEEEQVKLKQTLKEVASGEYISYEATNMSASGGLHYIDCSFRPIFDAGGELLYLCAEGKDITKRRKAQEARKKLEKQLHQAQKMEAIGTLAGGIAHDFNNILGAIIGFSELALEDIQKGDPARYSVDQVSKSAFRAKDLVKQILLFSRQGEQEMKPVRITPLVKEVLKLIRSTLQKNINVSERVLAENDQVMADPIQIHQIIMNLCTNSAHAMRKTGGTLTVILENTEVDQDFLMEFPNLAPGPHLKLQVNDSGHGIPDEVIDNIFEPFFTTKPRGEGTGLGLSVVHGIIKSHKGDIKVYSEPDKGTSIHILFPVLKKERLAIAKNDRPIPGGTEHILLVDDEIPLIESGKTALERLGYRVSVFSDSRLALEAFRKAPDEFDMVISDKAMPHMTGLGLSKKIIAIDPEKPIIMCTGFGDDLSLKEAEKTGIAAVLYKPVIKRELAETIRRIFDSLQKKEFK